MSRTRILLADDHEAVLSSLARLLEPEFHVVGAVGDGAAVLAAARTLAPDIIILDISMPVVDGIETARRLSDDGCSSRLIFYTMHADRLLLDAAMSAGAAGYVLKADSGDDLITAIRSVVRGGTYRSPSLVEPGNPPDENQCFS